MKTVILIAAAIVIGNLFLINNKLGYIAEYQEIQATKYEYHINLDNDKYLIYNEYGQLIATVPMENCQIDNVFINDNL